MNKKGSLEVVCGPMFSGKSEELIRRLRRANIARQTIAVFKNKLDDRHTLEQIVSHNGNTLNAIAPDNLESILEISREKEATVVGIDEVQFFSNEIVPIICSLVEEGRRVIVAGLDLDFRGVPFGSMPLLLAIADKVLKLQAICTICGADAHHTQRLINNKPARYEDPIVLIGAQEAYQARCRNCFSIDKMFNPLSKPHENQNCL